MTPYYSDDLVTIYHGDCRDWMPSADAVLTDPPYGVGKADWDDAIPDPSWITTALAAAPIVAFTSSIRQMYAYPAPEWVMAWARPGSTQVNGMGGINNWEPILVYGHRPLAVDLITLSHTGTPTEASGHPTVKPVRLYSRLVTTLVAAKGLSRQAIGIDLNERYCEIAAQRCSQEVLGLSA